MQEEIAQLKRQVNEMEGILYRIIKSNRYVFDRTLHINDGRNVELGIATGTKIGIGTTQKLAFHGSTPVIQRSGSVQDAVGTTGSTQTTPYGYSTAAQADAIVTLVNELRAALVEKGIIKGSS